MYTTAIDIYWLNSSTVAYHNVLVHPAQKIHDPQKDKNITHNTQQTLRTRDSFREGGTTACTGV
jgi:hypothetical protein